MRKQMLTDSQLEKLGIDYFGDGEIWEHLEAFGRWDWWYVAEEALRVGAREKLTSKTRFCSRGIDQGVST